MGTPGAGVRPQRVEWINSGRCGDLHRVKPGMGSLHLDPGSNQQVRLRPFLGPRCLHDRCVSLCDMRCCAHPGSALDHDGAGAAARSDPDPGSCDVGGSFVRCVTQPPGRGVLASLGSHIDRARACAPLSRPAARHPAAQGTAVTVQAMVFGNMGDTSGTGVCFTRNPSNGERELYGEYLINAQAGGVGRPGLRGRPRNSADGARKGAARQLGSKPAIEMHRCHLGSRS